MLGLECSNKMDYFDYCRTCGYMRRIEYDVRCRDCNERDYFNLSINILPRDIHLEVLVALDKAKNTGLIRDMHTYTFVKLYPYSFYINIEARLFVLNTLYSARQLRNIQGLITAVENVIIT